MASRIYFAGQSYAGGAVSAYDDTGSGTALWVADESTYADTVCSTSNGAVYYGDGLNLRKYDITGAFQWVYNYNGSIYDIVEYGSGVLFCGITNGSVSGRVLSEYGVSQLSVDYGGNYCLACGADSSGNIYLAGSTISSTYNVRKINSSGTVQWSVLHGTTIKALCVDSSGYIYAAGMSSGGYNCWKLNPSDGSYVLRIAGTKTANAVAVDSSGNIYVGGTAATEYGGYNTVAKFNSSGTFQWRYDGGVVSAIEVDDAGNVYLGNSYLAQGHFTKLSSAGVFVYRVNCARGVNDIAIFSGDAPEFIDVVVESVISASDSVALSVPEEYLVELADSIDVSAFGSFVAKLIQDEFISAVDATDYSGSFGVTVLDEVGFVDAFKLFADCIVSAAITTSDVDTAVMSALAVTGAEMIAGAENVELQTQLTRLFVESAVLTDQLQYAANLATNEVIELSDNLSSAIDAALDQEEVISVRDSLRNTLFLAIDEGISVVDMSSVQTLAQVLLSSSVAFISSFPLEDGDYQAWVMNADTTGVTSYANFPMDSLFTYQGVPYGLTSTGLYRLEGDGDDGATIDTVVATGDLQFGTSRLKNVPRAYLYITQSGQTILKTISSIRGSRHETFYELSERTSDGGDDLAYRRVPLGRGVRGEWWRFEIRSVDGASIDLGGAEVLPVVLSRRG